MDVSFIAEAFIRSAAIAVKVTIRKKKMTG